MHFLQRTCFYRSNMFICFFHLGAFKVFSICLSDELLMAVAAV